ncbi:DnaD domain protein [Lacticaseibacillus pabuli]|uniref:DnaD domain protein n=1 Tax=Lacticaseibacillus pabuli TaxID=3025672 RepID=A0ABY7WTQ0_9LACO|nr:DnaD domain protein [Lacticaseibacillus sp. KACC 23028]WDF83538.1 DnaD domain protein [Lacticaseibacillus sp. KACC 23028]
MHPVEFTPQSDYLVTRAQLLSDLDRQTLVYLYQPLIGPVASALYETLWTQVKVHPQYTRDRAPHSKLLQTLGCDLDALYDARVHLEAVGLMKTYTQVDQSRHYIYEMYSPLRPADFIADDLLGTALYDAVGPAEFAERSAQFTVTPVRRQDMKDLTRGFMDVYHVAGNVLQTPEGLTEAREQTRTKATPLPRISNDVVDWELLARLLSKQNLRAEELSSKRSQIAQIAGFYGMTTSELARTLARAIDGLTGTIDLRRLQAEADTEFAHQSALKKQGTAATVSEPATTRASAPATPLSAEETDLLNRAKRMSVAEFLEAEKTSHSANAFVAPNETRALRQLTGRNVFDIPTINILVAYVLEGRTSINQSFLDAIANSWIQAGVNSPESALAQIRDYKAGRTSNQKKQQRNTPRRGRRVEKQPDWADKNYKAPTRVLSPAEQKQLNARIAALSKPKDDSQK